jgi:hypothetical protein
MGKGPLPFKGTDVTRAFKAAKKAGVDVLVEIDLGNGKKMTIRPVKAGETDDVNDNPWNEVLPNGTPAKIR